MDIDIIRAEKRNALEFYRLETKCFEMEDDDANTMYYWIPMLSHQCCYKAVERSSLRIVGGIVSMPTFDKHWYINSLFVDPSYRRNGIASRLMEKVIEVATHGDIVLDVKTDRPYLIRFYKEFGFGIKRLSVDHYHDDSDRFIMTRTKSKV